MARRRAKRQSKHAYVRCAERLGLTKHDVNILAREASKYGKSAEQVEDETIKHYLLTKGRYKRVKLYKGIVVVIAKSSNRLITAYPLPKYLLEKENKND